MTEAALSRQRTSLWSAALTLSLATLLTRLSTFVTQTVIAYRFGTGVHTDAYFAAEHVLLLFGDFIVIGFGVAFIPLWMEYRVQHDDQEAQKFASALISLAAAGTSILAIVVVLVAPILVRLVAPGFSGRASETAAQLLTTMAPVVAFLGLTAGCIGILEAHRRFVLPEIGRMAYRVIILISTIVLSGRLGVMALAWGTVAGSLVRLVVQLPSAQRLGAIRLTQHVNHEGVRRVGKLIVPIFIAYGGMKITVLLCSMVASTLHTGSVSGLAYAVKIMLLPVGLLVLPLRTTIFPTLADHAARNQLETVGETAMKGLRLLSVITIPVCAGMVLLRVPVIRLLLQRGAFDGAATRMTASALGWYALSLPAIGGMLIVNSIFFSLGEPMTLVKLNLVTWVSSLGLSLALVDPLGPSGIALGMSLSMMMTYALAMLTLKRRLPGLRIRRFVETVIKALLATGGMAGLLLWLWALLDVAFPSLTKNPAAHSLISVMGGVVFGASVYCLTAVALRMEEALVFVRGISQWLEWRR